MLSPILRVSSRRCAWVARLIVLQIFIAVACAAAPTRTKTAPQNKIVRQPQTTLQTRALPRPQPASQPQTKTPTSFASLAPRSATALDRIAPFRRCLWVSRWEYTTEADVARICSNAASARFTDLFFQVRGAGSVFYASALEPWAPQITDGTGRHPGWDPLATVLREAKKYGLRVHAYMNVLPGCTANETGGPLYQKHRSWFMVSKGGYTMRPSGGWYAFLDPGLPEVRQYLATLFAEVAAKYPVDGIHLDYIRYPEEKGDYSYHPAVLKEFRALYSGSPESRPEQWAQFRRRQVTLTVEAIARAVRRTRPGVEVSASVVAELDKSTNRAFQSALEWVRTGLLDAVAPMAYSGDMARFADLCAPYADPSVRGKVWLGVWAEPKRNDYFEQQLRRAVSARFGGISVFSYENLFPHHKSSVRARGAYQAFVGRQVSMSTR